MTCPNCGTLITCGCQRRTASNGTQCCQTCIGTVEANIKKIQFPLPPPPPQNR